MPVKFTRPLIRVAERVLGLVGTPLPTSIQPEIGLSMETRAIRPWEEFDERILRWSIRFGFGAVAAEFGIGRLTTSAEGSPDAPRGTVIVLDGAMNEGATQTEFGWFDNATINVVAANAVAHMKDNRDRPFTAASLPMAALMGSQVGAGTSSVAKVLTVGQDDSNEEQWGYVMRPIAAAQAGQVLAFRTAAVNTTLSIRCWGRVIFPR